MYIQLVNEEERTRRKEYTDPLMLGLTGGKDRKDRRVGYKWQVCGEAEKSNGKKRKDQRVANKWQVCGEEEMCNSKNRMDQRET